jgi:hypothetical protein
MPGRDRTRVGVEIWAERHQLLHWAADGGKRHSGATQEVQLGKTNNADVQHRRLKIFLGIQVDSCSQGWRNGKCSMGNFDRAAVGGTCLILVALGFLATYRGA